MSYQISKSEALDAVRHRLEQLGTREMWFYDRHRNLSVVDLDEVARWVQRAEEIWWDVDTFEGFGYHLAIVLSRKISLCFWLDVRFMAGYESRHSA